MERKYEICANLGEKEGRKTCGEGAGGLTRIPAHLGLEMAQGALLGGSQGPSY